MDITAVPISPKIAKAIATLGVEAVGADVDQSTKVIETIGRKGGRAVLAKVNGELVGSYVYGDALTFPLIAKDFALTDALMSMGKTSLGSFIYLKKGLLHKGLTSELRDARDVDAITQGYEYVLVYAAATPALHAWAYREGDVPLVGFKDDYGQPALLHKLQAVTLF